MPIKVNMHDSSSTVRVRPVNNTSEVPVRSDCNVDHKRLEGLIHQEAEERKEADIVLQDQIDEINISIPNFIPINDLHGYLEETLLNLLIENKVNRISFESRVYYLSMIEGNIRKYFSTVASSSLNEIDVNIETGEYEVKSTLDKIVEDHLNDNTSHITELERIY